MTLYAPPTQNGLQKTLDAQLSEGATSAMTLNNVTGIQNKPGVLVVDRIDSSGAEKSSSVREWIVYSAVSGSTLTGLTRGIGGSTDQDHVVGAIVEFVPDITVFQAIYDALTIANNDVFLDQDDMASDSATKSATQQSIKAYVDSGTTTLTNKTIDGDDNTLTDLPAANLKIASQAQGDILYHDGSSWARLGAGTSGHFLKTQGPGANPTWAAQSSATFNTKVIATTYDLSTASGNQTITGAGFTPKSAYILAAVDSSAKISFGMDDVTTHKCITQTTDPNYTVWTSHSIVAYDNSGSAFVQGAFSSFNSDGGVIAWTKTGSPTGTLTLFITFYG